MERVSSDGQGDTLCRKAAKAHVEKCTPACNRQLLTKSVAKNPEYKHFKSFGRFNGLSNIRASVAMSPRSCGGNSARHFFAAPALLSSWIDTSPEKEKGRRTGDVHLLLVCRGFHHFD